ncbi:hypothetical protein L7F22_067032 [Adiantum nelumboides]|nr:hypothetical protein [Adiantum nelumboides]
MGSGRPIPQQVQAPASLIPSTVRSYHLDKLTGPNYLTWATRVTLLLKRADLWDIVSGVTPQPAPPTADWTAKDLQAQAELMLHLADRQVQMVRRCQSAAEIWNFLRAAYHHEDLVTRVTALKKLLFTVLSEQQDVSKFLDDWRTLLDTQEVLEQIPCENRAYFLILYPMFKLGLNEETFFPYMNNEEKSLP